MLIAIDAGHGGRDKGGRSLGLPESKIALLYALEFERVVRESGVNTLMTRESDIYVSLTERCNKANKAQADIFISFHGNASTNDNVRGPWTLYAKGSAKGRRLATTVQRAMVGVVGGLATSIHSDATAAVGYTERATKAIEDGRRKGLDTATALKSAGVTAPYRTLAVLRQTKMPAIIVELGFMTNHSDLSLLQNNTVREMLCRAVAKAIFEEYRLPLDKLVPRMATPGLKLDLTKIRVPTKKHLDAIVERRSLRAEDVLQGLGVVEVLLDGIAAVQSGDARRVVDSIRRVLQEYRG